MIRLVGSAAVSLLGAILVGSAAPPPLQPVEPVQSQATPASVSPAPAPAPAPARAPKPTPPVPPSVQEALERGVLVVVSLPAQKLFVFKDGEVWGSSPVSTGRRGHETPAGTFPILQKAVHHRSNLYSNAPMPYMQRLTRGGVALHAGHLPGHRASHGCIRLPWAFAKKLYGITGYASTAVLVTHTRLGTAETALRAAGGPSREPVAALAKEEPRPAPPPLAPPSLAPPSPAPPAPAAGSQTIQLAALASPASADMLWQQLRRQRPELAGLEPQIVPATVNSRRVFRLRASGPAAHSVCRTLASSGVACLNIAENGAMSAANS